MRPIKFRAWDTKKSCYYQPIHEAYKGNLFELLIDFSGRLGAHTVDGLVDESKFPGQFVLEQFTGLLDKNGKEIYEGDIVEKMIAGKKQRQLVEWVDAGFHGLKNILDCEVIGNLHENPELLK